MRGWDGGESDESGKNGMVAGRSWGSRWRLPTDLKKFNVGSVCATILGGRPTLVDEIPTLRSLVLGFL
jgi:hypothetical protein